MILSILKSSDFKTLFGAPDASTGFQGRIIATSLNGDRFLVLSKDANPVLTAVTTVPSGYTFTYCQEWGLAINDAVVNRVIADLRANAYPELSVLADGQAKQTSTDPVIKSEGDAQVAKYFADCLSVKAAYPKGF